MQTSGLHYFTASMFLKKTTFQRNQIRVSYVEKSSVKKKALSERVVLSYVSHCESYE